MHLQQYNLQESLNDYKYNKLLQAKKILNYHIMYKCAKSNNEIPKPDIRNRLIYFCNNCISMNCWFWHID
jgi:hypothetical protein